MTSDHLTLPAGVRRLDPRSRTSNLRALLNDASTYVVPGASDALSARLIEEAGFELCYVTGAGIANAQFGLPDVGLITLTEMAVHTARIVDAVEIPVLVDGDTGHGGPMSVMRTVHEMEKAGASGVQLEDQVIPKRCGHFDGKHLVPVDEMVAKLRAACLARSDPKLVIVARTDARAVDGFDAAIERARRYIDAGADAIFVEAPESVEEFTAIPALLPGIPLLANVVEGGKSPELSFDELEQRGYRLILHANLVPRVMYRAAKAALADLRIDRGSMALHDRMLSWEERQRLVNLTTFDALEDHVRGLPPGSMEAISDGG